MLRASKGDVGEAAFLTLQVGAERHLVAALQPLLEGSRWGSPLREIHVEFGQILIVAP